MAEKLEKPPGGLPQSAQPEETYKTPDPRPHYLELDSMRGIAVLGTVTTHAVGRWWTITQTPLYVPLLNVDLVGLVMVFYLVVPLFFLLSGYLLTWTEEKRERRGSYNVLNYAKRRALRIVPAYYVAIAVVILVWPSDPSFGSVVLHLTFLQGFDPSYPYGIGLDPSWWTFTPEVLFYVMLPLLVLKFRKFWQRATIFGLLLLISLATRLLMAYDFFGLLTSLGVSDAQRLYYFPTTLLYLFLAGVLLRMIIERRTGAGHEPGYRQLFAISALTVVPIAVVLAFPYYVLPYYVANQEGLVTLLGAFWPNLAEVMVILIFASVLMGSPILKPVLRWKPLVFIGEMSYSLFLLHGTIIIVMTTYILRPNTVRTWLLGQSEPTVWVAFFAYVLVVLAVAGTLAYLSFRYIESPFLRIKPK